MTLMESITKDNFHLFRSRDLVPSAWKGSSSDDGTDSAKTSRNNFRVFNPTLVEAKLGYAMAYRVVDEHHSIRRLATCRLSKNLKIIKSSITPLSDIVDFAKKEELNERALTWHADPRYFRLGDKTYLLWNDGANKPSNNQFLQEMSDDGIHPVGKARQVLTDLERRTVEKNWMFFENAEGIWAIYAIVPHHILKVDLSDPDVVMCRSSSDAPWGSDYSQFYGVLRGSAQPILEGDEFLSIAHSSYKTTKGRVYQACFYSFETQSPFRVKRASRYPFEMPNPIGDRFDLPRLNQDVHKVVYPCGLVKSEDNLLVSFGINDEICAIAKFPLQAAQESLAPVTEPSAKTAPTKPKLKSAPEPKAADWSLPVFWWNAVGKKFDGPYGTRNFHTGNFGDIAANEVVALLTGGRIRPPVKDERKILSIGSVLHTARDGDLIWGCGAKGTKMQLDPSVKQLDVHAVRGPLTLGVLLRAGIDISKIKHLFDPGCLVPRLYEKEIAAFKASPGYKRGGLRVVPHYRDDLLFYREYPEYADSFVSVDCTPLQMVEALLGADIVVSSSLHGIIFAEALGIPAYWHAPLGGEDETKFYDYYYGTNRYHVKRFESLYDALKTEPMELPTFDFDGYLATFPIAQMMSLSDRKPDLAPAMAGAVAAAPAPVRPAAAAEVAPVAALPASGASEVETSNGFEYENFLPASTDGAWAFGNEAAIRARVEDTKPGRKIIVSMRLRPFNSELFKRPQSVRIMLNGAYAATADWPRGNDSELALRLSLDARDKVTPISLAFQARNARTPWSLEQKTHPLAKHQIAFCVKDLTLMSA